ncbi:nuclear transport factor 2 family protein [Xanthomonas campestris pv. plantaginis]
MELRLLDPQVRGAAAELETLLDPAFVEFGASGRCYTREEVIAALTTSAVVADYVTDDFSCVLLVPQLAQLRYRTRVHADGVVRCALRSSLWRLDGSRWRMLFHQATPFTDNPAS